MRRKKDCNLSDIVLAAHAATRRPLKRSRTGVAIAGSECTCSHRKTSASRMVELRKSSDHHIDIDVVEGQHCVTQQEIREPVRYGEVHP